MRYTGRRRPDELKQPTVGNTPLNGRRKAVRSATEKSQFHLPFDPLPHFL
jgi:hypothetical protein